MKKSLKIALPIAAAFLIAVGIGLYFASPLLAMRPIETGEITYAVGSHRAFALRSGRGNLFLVDTGNGFLMIDAGASIASVQDGLDQLGIDAMQVNWIFLTHSDYDHVAALPLFQNAEIYMSKDEIGLLNGTVKRNAFGGNKLPRGIELDSIILLSDGAKLELGGITIKCTRAPGHTPGSMVYNVYSDPDFLFTGDAMRCSKKRGWSVHPFTMDKAQAEESMWALPGAWITLTSHYGHSPMVLEG